MRLVDADEIKKRERDVVLANGAKHRCFDTTMLFEIPTVDSEPVVRCKDCKWYKESKNPEMRPMRFCYRLKNDNGDPVGYNWDGNDFCSHGERRDKRTASYYGDNKLIETIVIDERKDDDKH